MVQTEPVRARIRRMLDQSGAQYEWLDHEKVFSMDECRPIGDILGARHCKNLLLTNRRQTDFYLLLTDDKPFKTSVFSKAMGISRVSFVPSEIMPEILGVMPGSASPLALINDVQHRVQLVVDAEILAWSRICVHPGDSTASLAMDTRSMLDLCRDVLGHDHKVVTL